MSDEQFENIWDAIAKTPEEAKILTMRSELMLAIKKHVKTSGVTQAQAAELLGLTQPRMSDLLRGKFHKFNLEMLMTLAEKCGIKLTLQMSAAA
jgi:predicted XRE-type DNA-binding protein